MNLIDLKERIAISPAFSKEECNFLLDAINAFDAETPDGVLITPNTQKIDILFVWLSVDGNGNEGIMSAQIDDQHFPCVTSNKELALKLRGKLQHAVRASGGSRDLKLMTFERGEEL